MQSNIYQKKYYINLYERRKHAVWSQDDDENSYRIFLEKLGKNWILGQAVLDVGCGEGKYSLFLAEMGFKFVLGIDFVESAIAQAIKYQKFNLQFLCRNLFEFYTEEDFGLFFDRGVFSHLGKELTKIYLNKLDDIGSGNYKILLTCFAEEYHLEESQKYEKLFYHNDLLFVKYTKHDLTKILGDKFRILKIVKDHKSNNRVFWHLLAERKCAAKIF